MGTIKERVDDILQRPMTRQQFLKQVGLMLLAVVGVTNLINTLDSRYFSSKTTADSGGSSTYGSSVYAGGKKPV